MAEEARISAENHLAGTLSHLMYSWGKLCDESGTNLYIIEGWSDREKNIKKLFLFLFLL